MNDLGADRLSGLLAPDEPEPVRVVRPDGASDFLLTADHAGAAFPRALGDLGLPASERYRHIAWDIGIAGVTERLAALLDASAVLQTYSRLVIDCNRRPGHPTSIPPVSETTPIPGNEALSEADRARRREAIFDPYHHEIARRLDARQAAGRRSILVAMHSFTPVFKGVARTVEVGVLYYVRTRLPELPRIMLDLLRAEGDLAVGDNEPYAITDTSDYTVPIHGETRGLPHVELEIRQDLIADAAGQARWAIRLFKSYRPDFADGEQRRDFVYVKDCAAAVLWLWRNEAPNGIYNLGSGVGRSFRDLMLALGAACGRDPVIDYVDMPESLRPNYQYCTEAPMAKLRAAGYAAPFSTLEDAVRDYVAGHLSQPDPYL